MCGSTCTCASCGQLFLVPEVNIEELRRGASEARRGGEAALQAEWSRAQQQVARLEGELRTASERWMEREREFAQALEQERERERAAAVGVAEAAYAGQISQLNEHFNLLLQEKAAAEQALIFELERERTRAAQFEASNEQARSRAIRAESAQRSAAEELERLRNEAAQLRGALAQNPGAGASLESQSAEELARERAKVRELEQERDFAVKRADQTDAGTKALTNELDRMAREKAELERSFREEAARSELRIHEAEKAKDAVSLRNEELEKEILSLKFKLEDLSKKVVQQISAGEREEDAGLARLLELREQELKRVTEQLGLAKMANRALSEASGSQRDRGIVSLARARLFFAALAAGLILGVGVAKLVSPSKPDPADPGGAVVNSASPEKRTERESTAKAAAEGAAATVDNASEKSTAAAKAPDAVTVRPPKATEEAGGKISSDQAGAILTTTPMPLPVPPVQALQPGTAGSGSGMPGRMPDSFLGIRFGSMLSDLNGRGQWQETSGRRHRKAELLGIQVEAVLSGDEEGRFIMGSYVRVVSRQPNIVTPFLEWAVNSQDAVSALYGEPSRVHQVEGATDAGEVVRRITSGEDYYEAIWEREAEDTVMNLSIRLFNERSVVFRLEYRSRELTVALAQRQMATQEKPSEKASDKPSDKVAEKTPEPPSVREVEKGAEKTADKAGERAPAKTADAPRK